MKFDIASLRIKNDDPVMSYINLRRAVGILGMVLPLICFLGGLINENISLGPSISSYYYTNVQDALEGILVGVAIFLLAYRGYELIDDIVSTITGIAGLGIAVFPCLHAGYPNTGFFQLDSHVSTVLHGICAGLFFPIFSSQFHLHFYFNW